MRVGTNELGGGGGAGHLNVRGLTTDYTQTQCIIVQPTSLILHAWGGGGASTSSHSPT